MNYHPELKEFLRGGEAEFYVGVDVEYVPGELPVMTVVEEGDGGEDGDRIVQVVNLWTYRTREELRGLMSKWFKMKDRRGQIEAQHRAHRILEKDAEESRLKREYLKERHRHVQSFRRDVMMVAPHPAASSSSPPTASTDAQQQQQCESKFTNNASSFSATTSSARIVDNNGVTSWLADNYDAIVKEQQQAAGGAGSAAGSTLFIQTNHREQRLTQGQASRNEAILKMYEEQSESLNFALKPHGHGASVKIRTKRRADAVQQEQGQEDQRDEL